MPSALDLVLQSPDVWRGGDLARVALPGVPTGFAELDAALPGGGWPAGALTEIHVERAGIGELQLFMPAAAHLTRSGRWLALVAPPYVPYAPAFVAHGVRLSRLLLIRSASTENSLWACEQALRSQTCAAALAWLDRVHERALRRLQLAAESGGASMLLYRPARAVPASPAALRLHIGRSQGRTLVRILKRRGGGLPAPIALDLHENERRGTGPFRQTIGAFPYSPTPREWSGGNGPLPERSSGAFPFPPHPPLPNESVSRETSGRNESFPSRTPVADHIRPLEAMP